MPENFAKTALSFVFSPQAIDSIMSDFVTNSTSVVRYIVGFILNFLFYEIA